MADFDMTHGAAIPATAETSERITAFLRAAYGWMCAGLGITAATAWLVSSSPSLLQTIARSGPLYLVLIVAQLGIVFVLSSRVQRLSASTASWLFIGYSILTGVTLSFLMLVYTGQTLTSTFIVASGMFGAMAVYGTVTRTSLAGWGQFLFMGLIGVVLASIVGIFWQSDALQFVTSFIGVIVFTGLAAYDAQRLKAMALMTSAGTTGSYAIVGALSLYLDFVNLFLMLLRLQGGGRRR
jgi:FtsH-binding integral membrane protein